MTFVKIDGTNIWIDVHQVSAVVLFDVRPGYNTAHLEVYLRSGTTLEATVAEYDYATVKASISYILDHVVEGRL